MVWVGRERGGWGGDRQPGDLTPGPQKQAVQCQPAGALPGVGLGAPGRPQSSLSRWTLPLLHPFPASAGADVNPQGCSEDHTVAVAGLSQASIYGVLPSHVSEIWCTHIFKLQN